MLLLCCCFIAASGDPLVASSCEAMFLVVWSTLFELQVGKFMQ